MRSWLVVVAVLASRIALAQPNRPVAPPLPKTKGTVPMRPVPCAMNDLELLAKDDDVVVCWSGGCMLLDLSQGTAAPAPRPADAEGWIQPAELKTDQVCRGSACKPLGKKLA